MMSSLEITCLFADCAKPIVPGTEKCASHKNKIKCSIEGCPNQVYARYLCVRHGGKKQCKSLGCRAFARGGPYCVQHGGVAAKRFCTEPGCHRQAHARHKCVRHGGGRQCKLSGCGSHARLSGYCDAHTSTRTESFEAVDEYTLLLCASVTPMPFEPSRSLFAPIDMDVLQLLC
ncbi:hypothetical protein SPRG_16722 [Saprolegnia parasitica CBS 223.65]|uniref:Uncharacterized protein n=1 Tax=Saprolegnia parasitica (strain CBS 223.65) TaxID=695850 RepID=A0A067BHJ4_SAPPC|nr:hypothetical protein SPRG_16722 [Saprolegnia parasitica CBS 223.65]KDO17864.1 hypothetical protein SPRG_16722 [Saprolegnia parasitica CBS 223.65]|eukprot:XP_012211427.1 hypothetical protein SPRG_16722 [Saprolegnia parasitica CBS 223.65]